VKPARQPSIVRWSARTHVTRVLDMTAPRSDGAIVVATNGRLALLEPGGRLLRFAPAYRASSGLEPYITLAGGCFGRDAVYALRLTRNRGITKVAPNGAVSDFARLPGTGLLNGIAYDAVGRFGHRLLATSSASGVTTVFAIDCGGRVAVVTRDAPRLEGGIAVAPGTFGAYAGDLIVPDEVSGTLYSVAPSGHVTTLLRSPTPHGQDIGIESEGFVPARFGSALVSDRLTPGNRHPGDDLILALSRAALRRAGVAAGQLLIAGEGGAVTIAVSCASACRAREVATGPPEAHIEGHVVFR
jgi:hypothetical protein